MAVYNRALPQTELQSHVAAAGTPAMPAPAPAPATAPYADYSSIPAAVRDRYDIDPEYILDIDRNGINQVGEWVTNPGYFDLLAKSCSHSCRDFIRNQHVKAAEQTNDTSTQEWVDKRLAICQTGIGAPTVAEVL